MRIGFDAKRAAQNRTGLGNYSRFILELLTTYAPENEYLLYTPNPHKTDLLGDLSKKGILCYPTGTLWEKLRSIWRVWGITNDIIKDNIQLFHGLSNELPLNIRRAQQTKTIVTIHDLIFLRYPEYYPFIDRHIYAYKFKKACINADRIIAVSECTKRDIMHFFKIPEEKIDVIYQGCDEQFKHPAEDDIKEEVKNKYKLPEKYLLYVGSIESRKNLLLVAKALEHIKEPINVIAIGKRTAYTQLVENFLKEKELEGRMRILHNIPFRELPAFYQMSTAFVYPSFFEGFGIPLLEALNSGVPAIGATGSCLEEAGGPHSLYIDPNKPEELAEALERTFNDTGLREEMINKGKEYALRFEKKVIAEELLQVYGKTIKESHKNIL